MMATEETPQTHPIKRDPIAESPKSITMLSMMENSSFFFFFLDQVSLFLSPFTLRIEKTHFTTCCFGRGAIWRDIFSIPLKIRVRYIAINIVDHIIIVDQASLRCLAPLAVTLGIKVAGIGIVEILADRRAALAEPIGAKGRLHRAHDIVPA